MYVCVVMSALSLYVVCFVPEALLQAVVIAMATYEQWFCSDKSDPMKQVLFCDSDCWHCQFFVFCFIGNVSFLFLTAYVCLCLCVCVCVCVRVCMCASVCGVYACVYV